MCAVMIELKHIDSDTQFEVGGKAGNLARLVKANIPVPDAWVVPAETFGQHLGLYDLEDHALSAAENPEEERCQALRRSILDMDLSATVLESLSELPDVSLAVRSSASVEDSSRGSYSGLFKTRLGVRKGEELADAIEYVWASVFTPEVLTYHRQIARTSDYPSMAVLIMPLLEAQTAGVAFSANPADGNPFRIVITAGLGLGTKIVEGTEQGYRYVLDLDSLDVMEVSHGRQRAGDFVQPDGSIRTEEVEAGTVLSKEDLHQLGEMVRSIDGVLERRVDVEFAFDAKGLAILQAREILGLPPYFPDNPIATKEATGCCHSTRTDPLPPFVRALFATLRHERIPQPPWPLEVEALFFRHGRAFYRLPPIPEYLYEERPDDPRADRTFLKQMQTLDDPDGYFREWYAWTHDAYRRVIPDLQQRGERLLALSERELASLGMPELGRLLQDAIDLENQAGAFYNSSSYPTAECVGMMKKLLQDWLKMSNWREAEQLSMTLIQGAPTLTHERDAELQVIAWANGDLETFVRKWGYSYLARDEQLYISEWKSWREDPQPLYAAVELMQHATDRRSIGQLVEEAEKKSNETFERVIKEIEATHPQGGKQRAGIFAACVKVGRQHFRMKDDRDLVLSHVQAALRWILLEAARRMSKAGVVQADNGVFLFTPQELLDFFAGEGPPLSEMAEIIERRRAEQARLTRYTFSLTMHPDEVEQPEGDVIQAAPGSPGMAQGKAHIVRDRTPLEDLADLEEGDILVLKGEGKVGLTMFFSTIAGLVYENGNGFCHEANLCRELGKPSVVCLDEKIGLIKEGERLSIDGRKGTVTCLGS